MEWEPDEQAWNTFVKFELRYKEIDRARSIFERFVFVHPDFKNWIRFARFEESHGFINSARTIFERAVEFFGEENMDEKLYIAFAKFEEGQKEVGTYSSVRSKQISGHFPVIVSNIRLDS